MDRRRFLTLAGTTGLGIGIAGAIPGTAQATSFPYFNRRIPNDVHTKIGEMAPYGITNVAFTPTGGWVITTQTGGYWAINIPADCYNTVNSYMSQGATIHCVAFTPSGGFVITTNTGYYAIGIPAECYTKIGDYYASGQQVVHVAFPPAGGNRWVVVGTSTFDVRNVDDECYQMMRNLTQGGRKITRVGFPYTGGWAIVAQDEFYTRGIDAECTTEMQAFSDSGWALHSVAFHPSNNGWSITTHGGKPALPLDRIRQIEKSVGGKNIWQRMADWKTPGVTIAVVLNNQIAWSTGYGLLETDIGNAAHPESVFQAASVSKAVTSVGILRHVQDTGLALGDDVRPYLNWQLGRRACVSANSVPTIDQLLGHRAGVIGYGSTFPLNACGNFTPGTGGGFGGYGPNATVPTLLQVMDGQGNSPKIELSTEPGAAYYYSGMGFVLLQRMMEQRTKLTLAEYMNNTIFNSLNMTRSTYSLTPNFELASGHTTAGAVIPGKRNRYPESAAAGLYTNVIDLCKLVRFLNMAWTSPTDIPGPLNKQSVTTLLSMGTTANMGRGFFTSNVGTNDFGYGHNGINYGFRSEFKGYPQLGSGYAVLANGDNTSMVDEIVASIKAAYGWK